MRQFFLQSCCLEDSNFNEDGLFQKGLLENFKENIVALKVIEKGTPTNCKFKCDQKREKKKHDCKKFKHIRYFMPQKVMFNI